MDQEMIEIKTDPVLKNIFKNSVFIKSKRQPKSLEDLLVNSRFSMERTAWGVEPCNVSRCKTCPLILPIDKYYFHEVDFTYYIRQHFDCRATNVIYVITCKGNCGGLDYIGKTVNLRHRMTKHRNYINDDFLRETYFAKHVAACSQGEFWVTPFYKMKRPGLVAHIATEDYFINKFKPALNTKTYNSRVPS